jgi:lipopolysaccharide export system permease protein
MQLLNRYFLKTYLIIIIQISIVSMTLIFLIDLVEISNRFDDISEITFYNLAKLSFYKLPSTFEEISPMVIVIGTLSFLYKLAKNTEIIIANALGISIWQIIVPIFSLALLFGIAIVTSLNPLGIEFKKNFFQLEQEMTGDALPINYRLDQEFWSSQENLIGEFIINAEQIDLRQSMLIDVTVTQFDKNMNIIARYDSKSAFLDNRKWQLDDTWITDQNNISQYVGKVELHTNSEEIIIEETILKNSEQSIWTINNTIEKLNTNNIRSSKHITDLNFFITLPLLMSGLVLVSACFMVKQFRIQHSLIMLLLGIITGLLIFVVNSISYTLSESEIFNPILGAWWHIILIYLIATKILITREDG